MEKFRERMEYKRTIKSGMIAALLGLIVILPLWLSAQEGPVRKVLYKDQWGNEVNCILEFWDVNSNTKIKSIDLLRENPLGKMGLPRIQESRMDTAKIAYDLRGKKLGDFLTAAEMSGYYPERRSPGTPLEYGHTSYMCYEISQDKMMVVHQVALGVDGAYAGNIIDIRIYDSKGEIIWRIPRYDKAVSGMKLSPDKRYIAHVFGQGDEYGGLYKEGFRVLDLKEKQYFDIPGYQSSIVELTDKILYCSAYSGGDSNKFYYDYYRLHLKDNVYDSVRREIKRDGSTPDIFKGAPVSAVFDEICNAAAGNKKTLIWRKFDPWWDTRGSLIIK